MMIGEDAPHLMIKKRIDWAVPGILGGLAAVLFVMAAVSGGVYRHLAARVERVEAWPTTTALVVLNEMKMVDGLNRNTGKWDKVPRLTLEYTYEVGGRSYTGKNVDVDGTGGKFVNTDYPVGSRMPVRYDPADPSIAGVKTELKAEMNVHWFLYAGAGVAALGLLFAGFAVRSLRRQRAST